LPPKPLSSAIDPNTTKLPSRQFQCLVTNFNQNKPESELIEVDIDFEINSMIFLGLEESNSKNIGLGNPLIETITSFDIGEIFIPLAETFTCFQQTPTLIKYLCSKPKTLDYGSNAIL